MITITVNGSPETLEAGTSVRQLLAARNLSPDKVAIELNRRLLRGDRYDAALEIVTFVGGG